MQTVDQHVTCLLFFFTSTCNTQVDESFQAAEGAQLSPYLKVAKHVGSGSTADVYKLQSDEQQPELVSCTVPSKCIPPAEVRRF
jgi:hypothetical protein